jgi:hypothetical protein
MRAPGSGAHHELSGVGHVESSSLVGFLTPILRVPAQSVGRISDSVIRRYTAGMTDDAFGSIRPTDFRPCPS